VQRVDPHIGLLHRASWATRSRLATPAGRK
jgi:hypothetical protein